MPEVPEMAREPDEVMSISELAGYLKVSRSTLYKLVQEGRLPGQKVGRHWRFRRETIDRWLDAGRDDTVSLTERPQAGT